MSVIKNIDVSNRTQYVKSLSNFILQSKNTVTRLLDTLGWKEESTVRKSDSLVSCPNDDSHRVPPKTLDDHIKKCTWRQQGYHLDDEAFPEPPKEAVPGTVALDEEEQTAVIRDAAVKDPYIKIGDDIDNRRVPQTTDRLFSDYTTDERRILYDYVVSKTKGVHPELKEFSLPIRSEEQKGPKTYLEVLAAERDSKRRRVRYKAKVHTKNKTYVEIMREVIKNQMEAYEDWLQEECGIVKGDNETVDIQQEKNEKETEKKEEKIWLEWNFQGNPHLRWKDILAREKKYQQRLKERTVLKEEKDMVDEDGRRRENDKYRNRRSDKFSEERENRKYDDKRYQYDRNSSSYQRREDEKKKHRYRDESEHKSRYRDYEYERQDREYRRYYEDNKYRKRHRSLSRESDSSKVESKKYEKEKTKRHKHKKKHKKKHSSKGKHRSSSSSSSSERSQKSKMLRHSQDL